MRIARYGKTRYWAVVGADGTLVCLCMYKRGALEVLVSLAVSAHGRGHKQEETTHDGQETREQ
jgi:hypothetical protein